MGEEEGGERERAAEGWRKKGGGGKDVEGGQETGDRPGELAIMSVYCPDQVRKFQETAEVAG